MSIHISTFKSVDGLREKLQIKSESLNLLGKQLELCNKEKLEYKRLIDMLYDKNLSLKKNLYLIKESNQIENLMDDENNFFASLNSNTNNNRQSSSNNKLQSNSVSNINLSKSADNKGLSPNSSINSLINDIDSEVNVLFGIYA